MITCRFENGAPAALRHVVVHAIIERNGALLLVRRAPLYLESRHRSDQPPIVGYRLRA
jgi:hypothetical protein